MINDNSGIDPALHSDLYVGNSLETMYTLKGRTLLLEELIPSSKSWPH